MTWGPIANKLHRRRGCGALFQWLKSSESLIRRLQCELRAIGGTFDAIVDRGFLAHYP
jgi:hypothetical protein